MSPDFILGLIFLAWIAFCGIAAISETIRDSKGEIGQAVRRDRRVRLVRTH